MRPSSHFPRRGVWLIAALLVVAAVPGRAWDPDGHRIIATLALDHLNPKAKAQVEALAPQVAGPEGPYDAVTLSCWMDDLRGQHPGLPYRGLFFPWHYIDLGIGPDDPPPPLEPGQDNETSGNVVTALKRVMVVLQGGVDPYVKSKAMACAMAMHLVGDIHQPLHASARFYRGPYGRWTNDAGGNKVTVVNGPDFERTYNLHYFWDSAWRASFNEATGRVAVENGYHHDARAVRVAADELASSSQPPAHTKLDSDFEAWARESNAIARDMVYGRLSSTENNREARISAEYVAMARPLARQRMVLAALRLAVLLNATLGADKPGPASAVVPDTSLPPPPK